MTAIQSHVGRTPVEHRHRCIKIIIILILIAALKEVPIFAVPIVLEEGENRPLTEAHIEYLEERDTIYTIDTVNTAPFVPSDTVSPNFGFTTSVLWVRFATIVPEGNRTNWFLEIGYPLLDTIALYQPRGDGSYVIKRAGDILPFDRREIEYQKFVFPLLNTPGLHNYYLRVETTSSLNVPLALFSYAELISEVNTQQMLYGIYFGALIIMALFNLLLALYTRDRSYYSYVMYIITFILVSLSLSGMGFQYLWRNSTWMNDMVPATLFLCFIWIIVFTRSFLQTKEVIPAFDRFLIFNIILSVIGFTLSFFVPYSAGIQLGAAYAIFLVPLSITTGIITLKRGIRQTRFYLIAFGFFLAGVLITALNRFGALPSTTLTVWSFQFGSLIQIVLLSLALGDRINLLTREKEDAQSEVLKYQEWLIESLQRADQLKDEFLNNLSHELKTPLQVMYSYAELLRDEDETDIDTLKQYGEKIYGNIDKLKTYIEDLVLITDIQSRPSLNLAETCIADLIKRSLNKFSQLTTDNRLTVTVALPDCMLHVDERYMQKAIDHIIKNAVLFNKRKGTISITAEADPEANGGEMDDVISIHVIDTGIGIPEEKVSRIWEKFYRVDSSLTYEVSGVGIGLYLAKRIIELHGGTISVESEPERGSRFTIRLPLRGGDR